MPPILEHVFYLYGQPGAANAVTISSRQIIIMAAAAILLTIFWYVVQKTALGRAQRAVEQDRKMAALLGVNVDRTVSITFVIGAMLASVAGTLYLLQYGVVRFDDGFIPGVKAFTAAVLGGIGSIPGAVLGGLLIGLIEVFWAAYVSSDYKNAAAFSILIIVLIFMPSGLLGRPEVEKV
jgi:branched-chain amino acid transport system permease protein